MKIAELWRSVNPWGVRQNEAFTLPLTAVENTQATLSQGDYRKTERQRHRGKKAPRLTRNQRIARRDADREGAEARRVNAVSLASSLSNVPPGSGILPPEPRFTPQPAVAAAQCLYAAVRLLTQWQASISASDFRAVNAPDNSEAIPGRQLSGGRDEHRQTARFPSRVADALVAAQPVRQKRAASMPSPAADASPAPLYSLHPDDNRARVRDAQIKALTSAIGGDISPEQQQQLAALLEDCELLFVDPPVAAAGRRERALESVMRERVRLYELSIKARNSPPQSVGARLIVFGETQTDMSVALFHQGMKNKDPRYFVASGVELLLGELMTTVGKVFTGEIVERNPGESRGDWMLRLFSNLLMPPDAVAQKAFSPVATTKAMLKPVPSLPGTVMTNPVTGLTRYAVLQSEIAGKRWHLFPQSDNRGTAIPVAGNPLLSWSAARNPQNNRWKINGIAGEHRFDQRVQAEALVKSAEGYYPLKNTAEEGVFALPGNKKIYFNTHRQQWQEYYPANPHLHVRALSCLRDELISPRAGEQSVLASMSGPERKIWYSMRSGKQYLEIRSRSANNPNNVDVGYVEGWLEGAFFSLCQKSGKPLQIGHQSVLEWQAQNQRWDVASSPFSGLQRAEVKVEPSRLLKWQQMAATPVAVYHKPGLYRAGEGYFLRWREEEDGSAGFLELLAGGPEDRFLPVLSGSGQQAELMSEAVLHYHAQARQWQFRQLTHRAFLALPDAVKVQPVPPLLASERLPGHQDAYQRDQMIYLHTGSDSQGVAEYIPVSRDREDDDLFTLTLPGGQQPERRLMYRYAADDAFLAEPSFDDEDALCRRKRAGDEACASSAVEQPAAKKTRYEMKSAQQIQQWFDDRPRLYRERLPPLLNESEVMRRMAYAARLCQQMPQWMSLRQVASHAGVSQKGLKSKMFRLAEIEKTSPDQYQWLLSQPQDEFESFMGYALRLYRLAGPEVSLQTIATWSGVNRASLKVAVETVSADALPWLNSHPRNTGEGNMAYALRLALGPHPGVSTTDIARHAGVDKYALFSRLRQGIVVKPLSPEAANWFKDFQQKEGESDKDYALRLVSVRDGQIARGSTLAKLVSDHNIAQHVKVNYHSMTSEVSRLRRAREWFRSLPRQPDELPAGDVAADRRFALRLVKQRYQDKKKKSIRIYEIADWVGVLHLHITVWIKSEQERWFSQLPRQLAEIITEEDDGLLAQRKNQHYSLRLIEQRRQQQAFWLINDQDIASHACVTFEAMREAQEPAFSGIKTESVEVLDGEAGWQPGAGLLHLRVQQNAPLLTAVDNPQHSITKQVIQMPIEISNINEMLKGVKGLQRKALEARLTDRARELYMTDGNRQDYFLDAQGNKCPGELAEYLEIVYDQRYPQVGLQVNARQNIPALTIVGAYTGVWHESDSTLTVEYRKLGTQPVLTYLWDDYDGVGSVSGYLNANLLALINTAEMGDHAPLGENNLKVGYINGKIPFYYTTREIKRGEQLLISYGNAYSPDYFIQRTTNNEVIGIVAKAQGCYFCVIDNVGNPLVSFGPEGVVEAAEIPVEVKKYYLQERIDKRGILRYDAFKWVKKRRVKIPSGRDDVNNLYRAMAKALQPQGGSDVIDRLIEKMVAEVKIGQGSIKTEPDLTEH